MLVHGSLATTDLGATAFTDGIPLPRASHIARWMRPQENRAYGRDAFLRGQHRMHGW
jgi:hypothetical protein